VTKRSDRQLEAAKKQGTLKMAGWSGGLATTLALAF
jgi:hypothetical protein